MSDDDQTGTNQAPSPEAAAHGRAKASAGAEQAGAAAATTAAPGSDAAPPAGTGPSAPDKPLSEPARRALAEAEARRAAIEAKVAALPKELGGRGGKEPGRYGDWEVKGIATDF